MPPKPARRAPARRTEAPAATSATASGAIPQTEPEGRVTPAQSSTPGPSGRSGVQRLQSLKKNAPSGSIAPSARSPSVLSGEPPKPTNKFRPKAVARKTKEQRDAIEKLEQERYNERLKEAAAIQRGRGGQRGQRGSFRGRGGAAGMAGHGPLGGAKRGRGGAASAAGRGRMRSAISGGKNIQVDDDSDEDDTSLLISIDQMNLYSDDDDEDMDIKGKKAMRTRGGDRGLRPVRVERHEHEERVVSVNMESSSSKAAEIRQAAEDEQAANTSDNIPAEPIPEEPRVKPEPIDDDDTPMVDVAPPQTDDDGFLPDQKVRVRRKVSDPKSVEEPVVVERETQKPKARDPRDLLRTKEEIDEYERHIQDLDHVRNLLYYEEPPAEAPKPATESTTEATETATSPGPETAAEEEPTDEEEKPVNEKLLGQLFLMQFPPMTPNLVVPGSTGNAPAADATDATTSTEPHAQDQIKTERNDDEVQVAEDAAQPEEPSHVITATTDWSLPAGRAGKLHVHKSGRVTMDWGGISFELDRAAAVDFAQEALIVSAPEDEGLDAPPEESVQHAWSMGQLSGKFTVTPNWDQML
ncbi:hypothetical protein N7492_006277 [Penicillium capsulatum]|uniref:DNA-directed RNA polymerase III RPC4 n=1 Tax=Penicillium capsulatum TaxID=69766 RepID=A0A9W9I177_9EURO|nr:hypothetical protein N7492_006277 [Penicillium capsulatum]KAJ6108928.1 hypothetical protein N7512_008765 [Penicillium capsulatum]